MYTSIIIYHNVAWCLAIVFPPAPWVCQGEINVLRSRTYKAPNLLVETGIQPTKLFLYPMKIWKLYNLPMSEGMTPLWLLSTMPSISKPVQLQMLSGMTPSKKLSPELRNARFPRNVEQFYMEWYNTSCFILPRLWGMPSLEPTIGTN